MQRRNPFLAIQWWLGMAFLLALASPLFPASTTTQPTFIGLAFPVVGNGAPAVGDFNGDGKLDIAIAAGGAQILLGKGDGTFKIGGTFPAGPLPSSIAVGDFNGDGKLDLAVSDDVAGAVYILLGNGDGTFQPAKSFATLPGVEEESIVVADFNNSGKLGVAVADQATCGPAGGCNTIEVLLGNGDGTLQPAQRISLGTLPVAPNAMVVGDFNNDGRPDLAIAAGEAVWMVLGNGNGAFQPAFATPVPIAVSENGLFGIAAGDFNADRNLDVVVTGEFTGDVAVLLGNGNGTFHEPVTYNAPSPDGFSFGVVAADFNDDGVLDLAVGLNGQFGILLGNGDGTFQPFVLHMVNNTGAPVFDANPTQLTAADFTGDGKPSLALETSVGTEYGLSCFAGTGCLAVLTNTTGGPPPPAAALSSLTLTPSTLRDGNMALASVALVPGSVAPPSGLVLSLKNSNTSVASTLAGIPNAVIVSEMANTFFFVGANSATPTTTDVDISVGLKGVTKTAVLTVEGSTPSELASMALTPASVVGGNDWNAAVTLTQPAPFGGATVTATSSNTSVTPGGSGTIYPTVEVPASTGKAGSIFGSTNPVSSVTAVTLSANYGGVTKRGRLTVLPPSVSSLEVFPAAISGGASQLGSVFLNGNAPSNGTVVTLTSSNPSAATVPPGITVPGGSSVGGFTITAGAVTTNQTVTISASAGGATQSVVVTIVPASVTISALTLNPTSVTDLNNSQGTVTLSRAPTTATSFGLSSNAVVFVTVPASFTVAAGSTSATFPITTNAGVTSAITATITATLGSSTASAKLAVEPPTASSFIVTSVTAEPSPIAPGSTAQGQVMLNAVPTTNMSVRLSSSKPSVAAVPSSVTVDANEANNATFPITTSSETTTQKVTITASLGKSSVTTTLTVAGTSTGK